MQNETIKSLVYLGVAGLLVLVAFLARPSSKDVTGDDIAGALLFPQIASEEDVRSIEIKKYNEQTKVVDSIELKVDGKRWVVASESNYPLEEFERLTNVIHALIDMKAVLMLSSEDRSLAGDHKELGLISPDDTDKLGTRGAGILVTLKGDDDKQLAKVILGNKRHEKDGSTAPGTPPATESASDDRYIRRAGEATVYVVRLGSLDPFSTSFADWVNEPILDWGDGSQISKLSIGDYSFFQDTGSGLVLREDRFEMELSKDSQKNQWNADSIVMFDREKKPIDAKLKKGERLDTVKLNRIQSTLSNLKISGVAKKVKEIEDIIDQDTGELQLGRFATRGLVPIDNFGFYVSKRPGKPQEILSSEGFLTVTTNDGIEYVLRFGRDAGAGEESDKKKTDGKKKDGEKKEDGTEGEETEDDTKKDGDAADPDAKEDETKLNRYLFVTARFNENAIPKPKMTPLPSDSPAKKKKATPPAKKGDAVPPAKGDAAPPAPTSDKGKKPPAKEADKEVPATKKDEAKTESPEKKKAEKKAPAKEASDKADGAARDVLKAADGRTFFTNTDGEEAAPKKAAEKADSAKKEVETTSPKAPEAADKVSSDKLSPEKKLAPQPAAPKNEDAKKEAGEKKSPKKDAPAKAAPTAGPAAKQPARAAPGGDAARAAAAQNAALQRKMMREQIRTLNKRKMEEYREKIANGKKKVRRLNTRFAPWYYIISENEYRTLHLSREDVVSKKPAAAQPNVGRPNFQLPGLPNFGQ